MKRHKLLNTRNERLLNKLFENQGLKYESKVLSERTALDQTVTREDWKTDQNRAKSGRNKEDNDYGRGIYDSATDKPIIKSVLGSNKKEYEKAEMEKIMAMPDGPEKRTAIAQMKQGIIIADTEELHYKYVFNKDHGIKPENIIIPLDTFNFDEVKTIWCKTLDNKFYKIQCIAMYAKFKFNLECVSSL